MFWKLDNGKVIFTADEYSPEAHGEISQSSQSSQSTDLQKSNKSKSEIPQNIEIVLHGNADEPDAIYSLSNYFLVQNRKNSIKFNAGKHAILIFASGTSMWLYGTTGGDAAPPDDKNLRLRLIYNGMAINFVVSWSISEAFINYVKSKQIPEELKQFYDQKKLRREKIVIGVVAGGAFLSAFPLSLAVFTNAKKITVLEVIEGVVTQIDNSFIHTFPMRLIAENKALTALFLTPLLPIIGLFYGIRTLKQRISMTPEELEIKKLFENKEKHHAELKAHIKNTIRSAKNQILNNSFKVHWDWSSWKGIINPRYEATLPNDLAELIYSNNSPDPKKYLLTVASHAEITNVPTEKLGTKICNFIFDTSLGWLFYIAGIGFVNSGLSGYYKGAYDDNDYLHNMYAQMGMVAYPVLIFFTLVSFYAARFFRNILYKGIIQTPVKFGWQLIRYGIWRTPIDLDPFPIDFKRYPKTILGLITLAFFVAKDGYGTGYVLIRDHFKEPEYDDIRPFLLFCAMYGNPIFNFKNAIDFIVEKAAAFAAKFGKDDNKATAILAEKLTNLENAIDNLDGDILEKSLKNKKPEEIQTLSRISKEKYNDLVTHKAEYSSFDYWFERLRHKKPSDNSEPLELEDAHLLDDRFSGDYGTLTTSK